MDGRMDEQARAINKLFNEWFDAGVFPHSRYAQNYANGASAGFQAGYRAALAAREAEVERLRKALSEYGVHQDFQHRCGYYAGNPCDCGLNQLIALADHTA